MQKRERERWKRCTAAGRDLSGGGDSSDKLIAHHRIWILRPATQSSTDISSFVADHDSHAQTPANAGRLLVRKLGGSRESVGLLAGRPRVRFAPGAPPFFCSPSTHTFGSSEQIV